MPENIDFGSNPHLIFFSLFFLVVFVLFNWAVVSLIAGNPVKGKRLLRIAFVVLFLFILSIIVFSGVSYIIQSGNIFTHPVVDTGETPPSLINEKEFPPAPKFIKLGNYFFSGPFPIKGVRLDVSSLVAVFCKKENDYGILDIEEQGSTVKLTDNSQYSCWETNCSRNNLYYASLGVQLDKYTLEVKKDIIDSIVNKNNPPCFKKEE